MMMKGCAAFPVVPLLTAEAPVVRGRDNGGDLKDLASSTRRRACRECAICPAYNNDEVFIVDKSVHGDTLGGVAMQDALSTTIVLALARRTVLSSDSAATGSRRRNADNAMTRESTTGEVAQERRRVWRVLAAAKTDASAPALTLGLGKGVPGAFVYGCG